MQSRLNPLHLVPFNRMAVSSAQPVAGTTTVGMTVEIMAMEAYAHPANIWSIK
jgi:hypothetical protein